jgi:hypothetical protein
MYAYPLPAGRSRMNADDVCKYAIVYNHKHICQFLLQQNADSKVVDKFKE